MEIIKYSKDSLETIKSSDFLVEKDWNDISNMSNELQDTFEKRQIWRTETEMKISVLNDMSFPTRASKYWQCVREQSVFFENLVTLSFEYRRNLVKIARIEKELEKKNLFKKDKFLEQELKIDLEEANFAKKNMEVAAKDRVREIRLWSQIKKDLDDGSFDTKDVNSHQAVSYTKQFVSDLVNSGDKASPSEMQNLLGKMQTALKYCEKENLLSSVLEGMDNNLQSLIKSSLK